MSSIVDAVVDALHETVKSFIERGEYQVLLHGVEASLVASKLGVNVDDVCRAARSSDGRIVVVSDGEVCRLLPREADIVRSILMFVPHLDFKLFVVERRPPKSYGKCRTPPSDGGVCPACLSAMSEIVRGLRLDKRTLEALERVYCGLAEPYRGRPSAFTTPFEFQVRAWESIFRQLLRGRGPRSFAILAGTGEGKTEAFLLPVILHAVVERLSGRGFRALLLYPRKALASDQLNRIIKLVYYANKALAEYGVKLRIGILDGDTPRSWYSGAVVHEECINGRCKSDVLTLHPGSVEQSTAKLRGVLKPYRRLACPRCGEELVLDGNRVVELVYRDAVYHRKLAERIVELSGGLSREVIARNRLPGVGDVEPILRCPRCGAIVDYVWLTKSDLAVLEPPDILVASIEAINVRLGDPTIRHVLENVTVVVVDEVHTLSGLSGAHNILILRRLLSINRDALKALILSSATISNPEELARLICPWCSGPDVIDSSVGRENVVTNYTYYLFIVPAESVKFETAATSAAFALIASGRKVLAFTESRSDAEELAMYVYERSETTKIVDSVASCDGWCLVPVDAASGRLRDEIENWLSAREARHRIAIVSTDSRTKNWFNSAKTRGKLLERDEVYFHHAGLTFDERRRVEQEFKRGKARFVAATSTLELGIDIGDVDAILLAGFPRDPASFFQRVGRAGRRPGIHPIIVTLVRGSYRDLHNYSMVSLMIREPKRFFKVDVALRTAVDMLASHALAHMLDKLVKPGDSFGYAITTAATALLAETLNAHLVGGLKSMLRGRAYEEIIEGVDKSVKPLVEQLVVEAVNVLEALADAFTACNSVRHVLALTAMYAWREAINQNILHDLLRKNIDDAIVCVRRLLEQSYKAVDERLIRLARSCNYNVERVLQRLSETRDITDEAERLIEKLRGGFARLALLTALDSILGRLRQIIERSARPGASDIALVTLNDILSEVRRIYVLSGESL